jgi:hypothetical protein
LRAELRDALDAVHEIRASGAWPIGWRRNWSSIWREVRRPLLLSPPKGIDEDALAAVERACAVLDQLENAVNEGRPDSERPLMNRDRIFLWRLQKEYLEPACAALGATSRVEPPPPPSTDDLREWEREPERRAASTHDVAVSGE